MKTERRVKTRDIELGKFVMLLKKYLVKFRLLNNTYLYDLLRKSLSPDEKSVDLIVVYTDICFGAILQDEPVTVKWLKDNLEKYAAIKKERFERKRGITVPRQRIYPLNQDKYNTVATKVWERKGRPMFRKRIVTGIRFGEPKIVTHIERYHYYKNVKVDTREFGVTLSKNGRGFVISCPD
jgi:hypothetical protein